MELSADFSEVSLTRVAYNEAWLTVRAESAEEVAAAITRLPGFDLQARVDQNMVVASVVREDSAAAPARAQAEGDQLLPQRARFRAFRPADRPSPSSSSPPSSPSEPPLATPTP